MSQGSFFGLVVHVSSKNPLGSPPMRFDRKSDGGYRGDHQIAPAMICGRLRGIVAAIEPHTIRSAQDYPDLSSTVLIYPHRLIQGGVPTWLVIDIGLVFVLACVGLFFCKYICDYRIEEHPLGHTLVWMRR